ncbi:MAG: hypothetical protein K0Q63_3155 [Paenibacillus sp.]|nr:hypothetical protein [Paenibacillus sp.]
MFIRHPIVVLPNGDWILPAYYCKEDVEYSIVVRSTDQGVTWREHEVPNSAGYVQMNVLPLQDGSLYAMFRSRNADRIYASRSGDSGQTWTAPAKTDMPNNNSSMQAVVLGDRGMALIYNDASLENGQYRLVEKNGEIRKKALRTPLTVALSEDEGATWPYRLQLQEADAEYWENEIGYSYPSILRTSDGTLHIAFTYLRKGLKYFRLTESDIRL